MARILAVVSLAFLFVSCRKVELIELQSAFERPIVFNDVEFLVEKKAGQEESKVALDPVGGIIFVDGQPLVRRLRYSIFEVEGKRYHFEKESKIFIFRPKPEGKIRILFKDLTLLLIGREGEGFVVRYKRNAVERIRYGISEVEFDGQNYLINKKERLSAHEAKKYVVKLSRNGRFAILENGSPEAKGGVYRTD